MTGEEKRDLMKVLVEFRDRIEALERVTASYQQGYQHLVKAMQKHNDMLEKLVK